MITYFDVKEFLLPYASMFIEVYVVLLFFEGISGSGLINMAARD